MLDSNQIQKKLEKEFPKALFQPAQIEALQGFVGILQKWSSKINLTAIKGEEEIWNRHLLDSLMFFRLSQARLQGKAMDLGSGAGLPAIPMAIVRPEVQVWAVDAVAKKISFQVNVKAQLKLGNLHPLHARHEDLVQDPAHQGTYDLVVTRALDQMAGLFPLADALLKAGGQLMLWKGEKAPQEEAEVSPEILARFVKLEEQHYTLPNGGGRMLLFEKRG